MPAPTTTCSICKETVLKAQTRHIGDGKRACKSHDGVMETAEKVHADQLDEIKRKDEAEKERRNQRRLEREYVFDPQMRCHACNCAVEHVSNLLFESVVASKAREMKGDTSANLLTNPGPIFEDVKKVKGDVTGCFVYDHSELTTEQWSKAKNAVQRRLRDGVAMFGFVCLCVKCVDKLGLPNKLDNLPQPDLKQLSLIGALMDPIIEEEVRRREQNE